MAIFVDGRKSALYGGGNLWRYLLIHAAKSYLVLKGGTESRSPTTYVLRVFWSIVLASFDALRDGLHCSHALVEPNLWLIKRL